MKTESQRAKDMSIVWLTKKDIKKIPIVTKKKKKAVIKNMKEISNVCLTDLMEYMYKKYGISSRASRSNGPGENLCGSLSDLNNSEHTITLTLVKNSGSHHSPLNFSEFYN